MKKLTAFFLFVASLGFGHDELSDQVKAITIQIQQAPNQADLYIQRAELLRADSHWKQAEQDYLKAKRLAPGIAATDLGLGLLYLSTNRLQESKRSLDRFLSRQPDHAEALVARGHALSKLGNRMAAVEEYSRALKLRPDPEIYIERSRLLSAEQKLQEAVTGLNQGIQQLGPIVTLELYAIELEIQLKRYDDALTRVDRIANQSERKETWFARRGEILLQASRKEEARKAYRLALEAIQKLPQARRNNRYTLELEERVHLALEQLRDNPVQ